MAIKKAKAVGEKKVVKAKATLKNAGGDYVVTLKANGENV